MSGHRVRAITRRLLQGFRRDRRTLALLFVAPIVILGLLGYLIRGSSSAPQVGTSTITFTHLFNANPDEVNAAERLTEASFDVYLADPRDICPGGLGPAPRCRGHLSGSFRFYFQRGRPGQPFP